MRPSQSAKNRAAVALATGTLGDDAFELGGHVAQFADAIADVGEVLARNDVNIAAGHRRVVVEAEQATDFFQAEAKLCLLYTSRCV